MQRNASGILNYIHIYYFLNDYLSRIQRLSSTYGSSAKFFSERTKLPIISNLYTIFSVPPMYCNISLVVSSPDHIKHAFLLGEPKLAIVIERETDHLLGTVSRVGSSNLVTSIVARRGP